MLKTSTFSETADLLAVKIALAVHHASQCDAHATFTDDDVYRVLHFNLRTLPIVFPFRHEKTKAKVYEKYLE